MFTYVWELGARNDVLSSCDHTRGFEVPSLNGRAALNVDSLYTVNLSAPLSFRLCFPDRALTSRGAAHSTQGRASFQSEALRRP